MINGSIFLVTMAAEAIFRSRSIAVQADAVSALTLLVLQGNTSVFDEKLMEIRPHLGQARVAKRMRELLHNCTQQKAAQLQDNLSLVCSSLFRFCFISFRFASLRFV